MKEIKEKLNYLNEKVKSASSDAEREKAKMELMGFVLIETIKLNQRVDKYGEECLSDEEKNEIINVGESFFRTIENKSPEIYHKVFDMALDKGYRILDENVAIECLKEIEG